MSSVYFVAYAAGQLINGIIGDNASYKRMIFGGMSLPVSISELFWISCLRSESSLVRPSQSSCLLLKKKQLSSSVTVTMYLAAISRSGFRMAGVVRDDSTVTPGQKTMLSLIMMFINKINRRLNSPAIVGKSDGLLLRLDCQMFIQGKWTGEPRPLRALERQGESSVSLSGVSASSVCGAPASSPSSMPVSGVNGLSVRKNVISAAAFRISRICLSIISVRRK